MSQISIKPLDEMFRDAGFTDMQASVLQTALIMSENRDMEIRLHDKIAGAREDAMAGEKKLSEGQTALRLEIEKVRLEIEKVRGENKEMEIRINRKIDKVAYAILSAGVAGFIGILAIMARVFGWV